MTTSLFESAPVIDAMMVPITITNAEGTIVNLNRAFLHYARLHGYEAHKEDLIGQPLTVLVEDEDDRLRLESFLHDVLNDKNTKDFRWISLDLSGHLHYMSLHAEVLKDVKDRVIGSLAVWEDVEEQIRHEHQKAALERIHQACWEMTKCEDIHKVLRVVYEDLQVLIPAISACSVQVMDEKKGSGISYQISAQRVYDLSMSGLAGSAVEAAWREQRIVYRPDLMKTDPYDEARWIWEGYGPIRSVVDVPFRQGTLAVNSTRPNAFSPEDLSILQEIAQALSKGFTRLKDLYTLERRNQELEEKNRLLTAFDQIRQAVLSSLELKQLVETLARQIVDIGIFQSLMIALVDEQTRSVEVVESVTRHSYESLAQRSGDVIGLRYSLDDENITAEVARTGEMRVVVEWDERLDRRVDSPETRKGQAAYFIPLRYGDRVLAVLATGSRLDEQVEMRRRIEEMSPLFNEVAIALQHTQLYRMVQESVAEHRRAKEALQQANEDLERRVQDRTQTLLRSNRERQVLSRRLLEVQEVERRTIARELHDEIGQALTAVKINLQTIQRTSDASILAARLKDSTDIIEHTLQQVRDLSLDLRPSMLDDLGLIAALRWYVDRQAQRAGFAVHLAADPFVMPLPPDIETVCFRVAQEALTNVARHAQARQVWIAVRQHNTDLLMSIRDDGLGFDVNTAHERAVRGASSGVLGMQERVLLAGGQIEIDSAPTCGTEVRVCIPLPVPSAPQRVERGVETGEADPRDPGR